MADRSLPCGVRPDVDELNTPKSLDQVLLLALKLACSYFEPPLFYGT